MEKSNVFWDIESTMTTKTVNFEEMLDKSLTQVERDLFQEILMDIKKDERTHLRRLLHKYDMYVQCERKHQEKLRDVLKGLATCKDEEEIELLIDERIMDLGDEIGYAQKDQKYIVEDIISHVRSRWDKKKIELLKK